MKDFVPYSEALVLRILGFDESCVYYVDKDNNIYIYNFETNPDEFIEWCGVNVIPAPLYQQAFRFFREKYKMIHQIYSLKYKGGVNYDYEIFSLVPPTDDNLGNEDDVATDKSMETYDSLVDKNFKHDESETYEDAELACLQKLIEIVKQKIYEQR